MFHQKRRAFSLSLSFEQSIKFDQKMLNKKAFFVLTRKISSTLKIWIPSPTPTYLPLHLHLRIFNVLDFLSFCDAWDVCLNNFTEDKRLSKLFRIVQHFMTKNLLFRNVKNGGFFHRTSYFLCNFSQRYVCNLRCGILYSLSTFAPRHWLSLLITINYEKIQ